MIILFGLTITKSRQVESDISITVLNILVSQKRNQNQTIAISRPGYSQDPELDHTNSKKMSKLLRSVQYNS